MLTDAGAGGTDLATSFLYWRSQEFHRHFQGEIA